MFRSCNLPPLPFTNGFVQIPPLLPPRIGPMATPNVQYMKHVLINRSHLFFVVLMDFTRIWLIEYWLWFWHSLLVWGVTCKFEKMWYTVRGNRNETGQTEGWRLNNKFEVHNYGCSVWKLLNYVCLCDTYRKLPACILLWSCFNLPPGCGVSSPTSWKLTP